MSDCWKCDKCGQYHMKDDGETRVYIKTETDVKTKDLCEACHKRFAQWLCDHPQYYGSKYLFFAIDEIPRFKADATHDSVDHPKHYDNGTVECIDWIEERLSPEEFKGYLLGNALKYSYRYADKGKPVEDLRKAQWYLKKLEELA